MRQTQKMDRPEFNIEECKWDVTTEGLVTVLVPFHQGTVAFSLEVLYRHIAENNPGMVIATSAVMHFTPITAANMLAAYAKHWYQETEGSSQRISRWVRGKQPESYTLQGWWDLYKEWATHYEGDMEVFLMDYTSIPEMYKLVLKQLYKAWEMLQQEKKYGMDQLGELHVAVQDLLGSETFGHMARLQELIHEMEEEI